MSLTTLAIIGGAIVVLVSVIFSIAVFRRKSTSAEIYFPRNSKSSRIEISKRSISQNVVVGDNNKVAVNSRLSDKEIRNLVDNISVRSQSSNARKLNSSLGKVQKRKSVKKE